MTIALMGRKARIEMRSVGPQSSIKDSFLVFVTASGGVEYLDDGNVVRFNQHPRADVINNQRVE